MSISKKVAEVFKPTFPRILMYMAFTFLVPTFLKVCTGEGCVWKLKFLAGYRLFMKEEVGILTFGNAAAFCHGIRCRSSHSFSI